ncbi:hypothetical protein TWF481_006246 [Arthrobotrys musiformis]|uniref:ParB/Sulfiredoxin domain-containing protein n=1 Tax=Arthrobotrys musiformis TaxID=47236 RepID=A0AAV9WG32_9PEZI
MERHIDAIEESLRSNFIGVFRCSLDSITFPTDSEPVDKLKLTKILTSFDDQFLRYQDKAITAIISDTNTISQDDRCDILQREAPAPIIRDPVQCIHGRHRILAAIHFCLNRPIEQRWWYVKIYSDNLSDEVQYYLANDFDFQVGRTEGEIYRRIRLQSNDSTNILYTRLKATQKSQLATFWRHSDVSGTLDALLPFSGLWKEGFSVSKLQRLCSLKCDKVEYDRLTERPGNREELFGCLDAVSVSELQLRVPGLSFADASFVDKKMADMSLFPSIETWAVRQEILERLRRVRVLIPSLSSFFRYLIFMEECANIMKLLVPEGASSMVYDSVIHQINVSTSPNTIIQVSETQFVERAGDTVPDSSYKQLWLFSMRNFSEMKVAKASSRKIKSTTDATKTSPVRWRLYASLIERFGIRVTQAIRWHGTDHEMQMALQGWILRNRPQDIYDYTASDLAREVQHVMGRLERIPVRQNTTALARPQETGFSVIPIKDRFMIRQQCLTSSFFLFLPHMQDGNQTPGTDISHFFVCKDFYRSFFESDFAISFPSQDGSPPRFPSAPIPQDERLSHMDYQETRPGDTSDIARPDRDSMGSSADARGPEDSVQNPGSPMQEMTFTPTQSSRIPQPETSQEIIQEVPQEIVQETVQEISQESTQEIIQETAQEVIQETVQEMSQEVVRTVQETPQEITQEMVGDMSQETEEAFQGTVPEQRETTVRGIPGEVPTTVNFPVLIQTAPDADFVQRMVNQGQLNQFRLNNPGSRAFFFDQNGERKFINWKGIYVMHRRLKKTIRIITFLV